MFFDWTFIILIPGIILATYAQAKVKTTFAKYSKISNARGITGQQAAALILQHHNLSAIQIRGTGGKLTDNYDPKQRLLNLSPDVFQVASVASVSVAAHEVGHAIQHAEGYKPLIVRNSIVPAVNLLSMFSWPLIIIGIFVVYAGMQFGYAIIDLGILFFLGVIFFHLITLPVEINASRRAIVALGELNILEGKQEERGAKRVLSAAALTYVAALAVAVLNLIRILIIRGSNN